jgi:hypothetical protein
VRGSQPIALAILTLVAAGCGGGQDDPTRDLCALSPTFEQCRASDDEPECVANGGLWGASSLIDGEFCTCPTGQGECPCSSSSQCFGPCISLGTFEPQQCAQVATGLCAPQFPFPGCFCVLDSLGMPQRVCID